MALSAPSPTLPPPAAAFGRAAAQSASPDARPGLIQWLQSARTIAPFTEPALIVVAHPDDEVIGVGAQLNRFARLMLVHVTDGSPHDLCDAIHAGLSTREEYALARQQELGAALHRAGQAHCRSLNLGIVDQEASRHLVGVTLEIRDLLRSFQPAVVLTHAYEGGHPDHDATALAVHAACHLSRRETGMAPDLVEMTSYHNGPHGIVVGSFLPASFVPETEIVLSETEQAGKRELLGCFRSQARTLEAFSVGVERFRLAPAYHFKEAPHGGRLYYEGFPWGMTGPRWRQLAADALRRMAITAAI